MNTDAFEGSETVEESRHITRSQSDALADILKSDADLYTQATSDAIRQAHFGGPGTPAMETARAPSGNTAAEVREVFNRPFEEVTAPINEQLAPELWGGDAEAQDMRLKRCGLVWRENQIDGHRWVARCDHVQYATLASMQSGARIKTLPLFMVKPTPGLEIEALDGEKYLLPKDFKGDWFSIKSPRGKELIP